MASGACQRLDHGASQSQTNSSPDRRCSLLGPIWRRSLFLAALSPLACFAPGCWRAPTEPSPVVAEAPQGEVLPPIVQIGHSSPIQHIVFSPDGRQFLTAAEQVCLWETRSGDKLYTLDANPQRLPPVYGLDGEVIIAAGAVWESATGKLRHDLNRPDETLSAQAISDLGERLILGTTGGDARVFDLTTGELVAWFSPDDLEVTADELLRATCQEPAEIPAPRLPVSVQAVAFAGGETPVVLLLDRARRLFVWNLSAQELQCGFRPSQFISGEFSPDGNFVVIHWDDISDGTETVAVHDSHTGESLVTWTAGSTYSLARTAVAFLPDGHSFVGRSNHRQVTLWDASRGQAVRHFSSDGVPIHGVELLNVGLTLRTHTNGIAQDWDLQTGERLHMFRHPRTQEASVHRWLGMVIPSPDQSTFYSYRNIHDAGTGESLCRLNPLDGGSSSYGSGHFSRLAVYSPDSKRLIFSWQASRNQREEVLYDVATGRAIRELARTPDPARHELQWNRDGRRAINRPDGVWRLWDTEQGRPLQTIGQVASNSRFPQPEIAFSHNGQVVYTHGSQFGVYCWDANTGRALQHSPPGQRVANKRGLINGRKHSRYYRGLSALSPDRRQGVGWYAEPTEHQHRLLVWDLEQGEITRVLDHAPLIPSALFYSPDGTQLAVGCAGRAEQRVVLWDLTTGEPRYSLEPPSSARWSRPQVHFLPDGERMLVDFRNQQLLLYEVATGRLIRRMIDPHAEPSQNDSTYFASSLLVSPDSRYALFHGCREYAIVWDLTTGRPCLQLRRNLGATSAGRYFEFSADSQRLLTRYGPATLWEIASGRRQEFKDRRLLQDLPGFAPEPSRNRQTPEAEFTSAPQAILDRFAEQIPPSARGVELLDDGRTLVIHHHDTGMAHWDIETGELRFRCYQLHNGSRWLTILPDGASHGNLEYVRYPTPPNATTD